MNLEHAAPPRHLARFRNEIGTSDIVPSRVYLGVEGSYPSDPRVSQPIFSLRKKLLAGIKVGLTARETVVGSEHPYF